MGSTNIIWVVINLNSTWVTGAKPKPQVGYWGYTLTTSGLLGLNFNPKWVTGLYLNPKWVTGAIP